MVRGRISDILSTLKTLRDGVVLNDPKNQAYMEINVDFDEIINLLSSLFPVYKNHGFIKSVKNNIIFALEVLDYIIEHNKLTDVAIDYPATPAPEKLEDVFTTFFKMLELNTQPDECFYSSFCADRLLYTLYDGGDVVCILLLASYLNEVLKNLYICNETDSKEEGSEEKPKQEIFNMVCRHTNNFITRARKSSQIVLNRSAIDMAKEAANFKLKDELDDRVKYMAKVLSNLKYNLDVERANKDITADDIYRFTTDFTNLLETTSSSVEDEVYYDLKDNEDALLKYLIEAIKKNHFPFFVKHKKDAFRVLYDIFKDVVDYKNVDEGQSKDCTMPNSFNDLVQLGVKVLNIIYKRLSSGVPSIKDCLGTTYKISQSELVQLNVIKNFLGDYIFYTEETQYLTAGLLKQHGERLRQSVLKALTEMGDGCVINATTLAQEIEGLPEECIDFLHHYYQALVVEIEKKY